MDGYTHCTTINLRIIIAKSEAGVWISYARVAENHYVKEVEGGYIVAIIFLMEGYKMEMTKEGETDPCGYFTYTQVEDKP